MTACQINRTDVSTERSFGSFSVDGVVRYVSLERGENGNTPDKSCIPAETGAGITYPLRLAISPHHGYALPHVDDVEGRSNILIHTLNWITNPETHVDQTLGCIGIGMEREILEGAEAIGDSLEALNDLMTRLGCSVYRSLTTDEAVAGWYAAHPEGLGTLTIVDHDPAPAENAP